MNTQATAPTKAVEQNNTTQRNTDYRMRYVLTVAILGFLSLLIKDWVSESWRNLHDDIVQSEAIYTLRTDVWEAHENLTAAIYNIENPYCTPLEIEFPSGRTQRYDDPRCDNLIAAFRRSVQSVRRTVQADFNLASHAEVPANSQLLSVDKRLKDIETQLTLIIETRDSMQKSHATPVSDPMKQLSETQRDFRTLKVPIGEAHNANLKDVQQRDDHILTILAFTKWIALLFFVVAGGLSIVGKRFGIDTSAGG